MTNKCISDRIQNYLEMFMDRMKDGYEYDTREEYESFYYTVRRKRKPFFYFETQEDFKKYERFRRDVMEFYLNEIRGELEYTNKNPRMVAASILYKFLVTEINFTVKNLLHLTEIKSSATITKLFKVENKYFGKYGLDIFYAPYEFERSTPIYCTLSDDYKYSKWGIGKEEWKWE